MTQYWCQMIVLMPTRANRNIPTKLWDGLTIIEKRNRCSHLLIVLYISAESNIGLVSNIGIVLIAMPTIG